MRRIYENAQAVLVWLGPETELDDARLATDSILTLSDYLCDKLDVSPWDLGSIGNLHHDLVFKYRDRLPQPDETPVSRGAVWQALQWYYSRSYFTRVWVLQEITANKTSYVHCGSSRIEWPRVDLVAAYLQVKPEFTKRYSFDKTFCWWTTTITELAREPEKWLCILYLASNYSCLDARDTIYGLRGLMDIPRGGSILKPDYSKSFIEVYRDSVEAAFVDQKKADALLYVTGDKEPSWVPRWNEPMLFRNPFRFGNEVPFKPARDSEPIWAIDKEANVLSLTGFDIGTVASCEPYNQKIFGHTLPELQEGRDSLRSIWLRLLSTLETSQPQLPFDAQTLTAAALSFTFGLDKNANTAHEHDCLLSFVAYLKLVLDADAYQKYVPPALSVEARYAAGETFGKPVWDFEYPESSVFVTNTGHIGCAISVTEAGDTIFVPLGSTYPLVLRPDDEQFRIKGYTYVYGVMQGELADNPSRVLEIK